MIDMIGYTSILLATNPLTAPTVAWLPIVGASVLLVIAVLAIVFMLSPLLGRNDIRSWARVKIYETLASIILIMIFLAFGAALYAFNPVPAFNSVQLVPPHCAPGSNFLVAPYNIFSLANCDMQNFTTYDLELNQLVYETGVAFSLPADIGFQVWPIPGETYLGFATDVSLVPATPDIYLSGIITGLATLSLLVFIQGELLGFSLLIFSSLMTIGLIARLFGVTRSFGGMMIALAVGIGFIYPLITSVSYGFLDYGLSQTAPSGGVTGQAISTVFGIVIYLLTSHISSGFCTLVGQGCQIGGPGLLVYIGLITGGLIFLPLLNFVIVDTFVIDFSQAIGERVDFLVLLERII